MGSLNIKLAGSLLLIVGICVGLMVLLTSFLNTREFEEYTMRGNMMYTQSLASNLGELYDQRNGWNGIQEVVENLSLSTSQRIIVTDYTGIVVADSEAKLLGTNISGTGLGAGTAIKVSGRQVGSLYFLSSTGSGGGMGHMMGGSMYQYMPVVSTIDEDFLNRVNTSIWQMGLIAALVAFVVGVALTRQITRPVKALTLGAQRLAEGELDYRVKVDSRDEIGKLAESFNGLAAKLDKGERARRQLTADIAHELKTPLTIIEGTVDGIMDGVFEPSPEHLQSIKDQSILLTRLIQDLRDLSLAESGHLKLNLEKIDLNELINRLVSQYRVRADEKNISLLAETTGPAIELAADPVRIEQVITNLLANAIRHTPGGGTITVSTATGDKSVTISIKDTGEGINPADLPHIFERFYRSGGSRARSEGGTGLGLSIVKQMVEAHGGKAWAKSVSGQGASFSFTLPVSK
ncbi:MAG: HAMP domain-containing protein [Dehalococcoidaceae bacterium]|nr:HAMP domain-containing protein [Dehalococcoidaceae bacterium]